MVDHTDIRDHKMQAAASAAQNLADSDSKFELDLESSMIQGKNNRVLRGTYDSCPVVAKFYCEDSRGGDSRELRKARELAFLHNARNTGFVPRVVAERSSLVLLELIDGIPLETYMQERELSQAPREISAALGIAHKALCTLDIDSKESQSVEKVFGHEQLDNRICRILQESLRETDKGRFGELERESIQYIQSALPDLAERPRILYKHDNNLGNVIVSAQGRLCGLIDFEHCFLGTRLLYAGAIFDCCHAIPWEAESPPRIYEQLVWKHLVGNFLSANVDFSMRLVVVAALLNHWIRVGRAFTTGRDTEWWITRFSARFALYMRMLEDPISLG